MPWLWKNPNWSEKHLCSFVPNFYSDLPPRHCETRTFLYEGRSINRTSPTWNQPANRLINLIHYRIFGPLLINNMTRFNQLNNNRPSPTCYPKTHTTTFTKFSDRKLHWQKDKTVSTLSVDGKIYRLKRRSNKPST